MIRRFAATIVVLFVLIASVRAADKTLKASLVKVDAKKKVLVVKIDKETKEYTIDSKTKVVGSDGTVSEAGFKDKRLRPGAAIKLVVADDDTTVREVHLPQPKRARISPEN
jgi:hypothetical protein